jgi:hypothetical protein
MKKIYLAPQTEAIEVIANGVLMVSPGNGFISTGDPITGGTAD